MRGASAARWPFARSAVCGMEERVCVGLLSWDVVVSRGVFMGNGLFLRVFYQLLM